VDFVRQAQEVLRLAIDGGREHGDWRSVGTAAHELVCCAGWADVNAAVDALCLYQSCVMQERLSSILKSAYSPINREGLFSRLVNHLKATLLHPGLPSLAPWNEAQGFVSGASAAQRRLDCSSDIKTIASALPDNCCVLVVTHSPDRRHLYCAVLCKDASVRAIGRRTLSPSDRAEIQSLVQELGAFRVGLGKLLLKYCDDAGAAGDHLPKMTREFVEQQQQQSAEGDGGVDVNGVGDSAADGDQYECQFTRLLDRVDAIFEPVLTAPAFSVALSSVESQHVVVIADEVLAGLPLESLSVLRAADSVARDFSLHFFHHRLMAYSKDGSLLPPATKDADTACLADVRHEDVECLPPAEPDSNADATPSGRKSISQTLDELGQLKLANTAAWEVPDGGGGASNGNKSSGGGVASTAAQGGANQGAPASIASPSLWQKLLQSRDGGAFIYYGLGRVLSYFAPSLLAGTDARGCSLALIVDRAENDASNRRQSKLDNQKGGMALLLERPFETAALFSLSGVNAVVINQWANSLHANRYLFLQLFRELKGGKLLGSALQAAVRAPQLPAPPALDDVAGWQKFEKEVDKAGPLLKQRVRMNTIVYGLPQMKLEK